MFEVEFLNRDNVEAADEEQKQEHECQEMIVRLSPFCVVMCGHYGYWSWLVYTNIRVFLDWTWTD